ncbi:hypothetical protein HPP92_004013 [Vanilla planifolia]|nr:hypothetical protein HPP92_004013 [Vanilla planifolia]
MPSTHRQLDNSRGSGPSQEPSLWTYQTATAGPYRTSAAAGSGTIQAPLQFMSGISSGITGWSNLGMLASLNSYNRSGGGVPIMDHIVGTNAPPGSDSGWRRWASHEQLSVKGRKHAKKKVGGELLLRDFGPSATDA